MDHGAAPIQAEDTAALPPEKPRTAGAAETFGTEELANARLDRNLPFLFGLGLAVTLATLPVDAIIVPQSFGLALLLKLGLVVPLQVAGILCPAPYRSVRKVLLGLSLLAFGGVTSIIASWSEPPDNVFHMLGTVLVLGTATPILPLNPRESAIFVALYVTSALLLFELNAPPGDHRLAIAILVVIVGAAAWLLARRVWWLEQANIELAEMRRRRVEELALANRHLELLASHDPLTGLANRRHFSESFEQRYAQGIYTQGPAIAVFMIDIDHFKEFNDRWGHQVGDDCLRSVGEALSVVARRHSGLAARFGGEEFVVLLQPQKGESAAMLAEAMRSAISHIEIPVAGYATTASCTASIGVALHQDAYAPDLKRMLTDADMALYSAKRKGRDRCEIAA